VRAFIATGGRPCAEAFSWGDNAKVGPDGAPFHEPMHFSIYLHYGDLSAVASRSDFCGMVIL